MKKQYIYGIARLHSMESSMLSRQDIERILSFSNIEDALAVLSKKGYDITLAATVEDMAAKEWENMYKLVSGLVDDMSVFDVLFFANDFQNLKAAVKLASTEEAFENIFVDEGTIPPKVIADAVLKRELDKLPEFLRDTAKSAKELFLETGDVSLCDRFIDKACLEAILQRGSLSDCKLVSDYAELTVALSDIKIALRGAELEKGAEFFEQSLASCKSISVSKLGKAAIKGEKEIMEYLSLTEYSEAAERWKQGYGAFEKWCDDKIMDKIREHKFSYFTLSPIAAYILAKRTELKMVRVALTALQNKLDTQKVKERLSELYV